MLEVGGGFGQVHRFDGEPGGDPVVERGEDAHAQLPVQRGLPGQDGGERGCRVHLRVRQEPQFFKLVWLQEVRFVDLSRYRDRSTYAEQGTMPMVAAGCASKPCWSALLRAAAGHLVGIVT